jgi:hypothetical protein
MPLAAQLGREG